jgi:release factor glutamine methyltransferase
MTAIEKLKEISAFLESNGIEDAAKEAELLITEALLKKQLQVLSFKFQDQKRIKAKIYAGDLNIDDETLLLIDNFAERRAHGEPLQYISGHVEFLGLIINVGSGVLIPRPETELLVEQAIKAVSSVKCKVSGAECQVKGERVFLDLCTGSGCIALALGRHFPQAAVYGIDKSSNAIAYAEHNAVKNKITNVHFMQGNLFEPVMGMKFDCIISNPPYIKRSEIPRLQREIRDYEPAEALDGGEDGLDFYRIILSNSPEFLKDNGLLIMEIGIGQSENILRLAVKANFSDIEFIEDYAGIKRIFIGKIKQGVFVSF